MPHTASIDIMGLNPTIPHEGWSDLTPFQTISRFLDDVNKPGKRGKSKLQTPLRLRGNLKLRPPNRKRRSLQSITAKFNFGTIIGPIAICISKDGVELQDHLLPIHDPVFIRIRHLWIRRPNRDFFIRGQPIFIEVA